VAARRRLTHRYRAAFADVPGLTVPYSDEQEDASSCYIIR
jgi:dTDP-4-amino-4,6-dideoxygalactose transaminase